jgi:hypothetical protein
MDLAQANKMINQLDESSSWRHRPDQHDLVERRLKPATLSMSDKIDQNAKHKAGQGKMKITPDVYDAIAKKWFKGSGTITNKDVAIQKQEVSINTKKKSLSVKPYGDYLVVRDDAGPRTSTKFFESSSWHHRPVSRQLHERTKLTQGHVGRMVAAIDGPGQDLKYPADYGKITKVTVGRFGTNAEVAWQSGRNPKDGPTNFLDDPKKDKGIGTYLMPKGWKPGGTSHSPSPDELRPWTESTIDETLYMSTYTQKGYGGSATKDSAADKAYRMIKASEKPIGLLTKSVNDVERTWQRIRSEAEGAMKIAGAGSSTSPQLLKIGLKDLKDLQKLVNGLVSQVEKTAR